MWTFLIATVFCLKIIWVSMASPVDELFTFSTFRHVRPSIVVAFAGSPWLCRLKTLRIVYGLFGFGFIGIKFNFLINNSVNTFFSFTVVYACFFTLFLWIKSVLISMTSSVPETQTFLTFCIIKPRRNTSSTHSSFIFWQVTYIFITVSWRNWFKCLRFGFRFIGLSSSIVKLKNFRDVDWVTFIWDFWTTST